MQCICVACVVGGHLHLQLEFASHPIIIHAASLCFAVHRLDEPALDTWPATPANTFQHPTQLQEFSIVCLQTYRTALSLQVQVYSVILYNALNIRPAFHRSCDREEA